MSNFQSDVPKDSIITFKNNPPKDYHCKCEYCRGKFYGEMYDVVADKYYSNHARKKYLPSLKDTRFVHNNPGQFVGYRFAIQNFTVKGDIVFDPTVGTGTAVFESENNGRIGIGVELEFPETAKYLCEDRGTIISGNTLDLDPSTFLEKESIQLLINGTPYPIIGGNMSSDAHTARSETSYGDYRNDNNIGKWKIEEFRKRVHEIYTKYIPYIKPGGYLILLIKDPCNNKNIVNLHKIIADSILENNVDMEYNGYFVHRHIPTTFFMNTYEKQTGVVPPMHQTGVVLRKIDL